MIPWYYLYSRLCYLFSLAVDRVLAWFMFQLADVVIVVVIIIVVVVVFVFGDADQRDG